MNRLRARVRRFRPIYIDIYTAVKRERAKRGREQAVGKKEGKNGL